MATLASKLSWLRRMRPVTAPVGGLLLVLGERVASGWPAAPAFSALGVLSLVLAVVWNGAAWRAITSPGVKGWAPRGWPQRTLALPPFVMLLGSGFYFLEQGLLEAGSVTGGGGVVDWPSLARWAWVMCWVHGAVLLVFVESAWNFRQPAGGTASLRLRRALLAGNGFGLLVLVVVTLNFTFNRLPWEWNLAYFQVTRPSAATRDVIAGLSEPVEGAAFFSADSPVGPLVRSYFASLEGSAPPERFRVHFADAHLQPSLAESFKARGNGWVVLKKGEVTAPMLIGEKFTRARAQLLKFDETVFKHLQEMARRRLTVYQTVGHGERNETAGGGRASGRGMRTFERLLRTRNFQLKPLGLSEGLGSAIPADATAVVIAGPTGPFRPAELASLRAYLEGGGRVLILFEPEGGADGKIGSARSGAGGGKDGSLAGLMAAYGIGFEAVVQGNDRIYGRRTYTKADHALLVTVKYQPHPAMAQMSRAANQFPLLFLGAGALKAGPSTRGMTAKEIILAMPGTWGDRNRNFIFDAPAETRGTPALAIAAERKSKSVPASPRGSRTPPGPPDVRILAFADADVFSDLLLNNRANRQVLAQSMAWLAGPGETAAYPASEADIRLLHAKGDDWMWFYLPVLGIPALVLGAGALRVRRLRGGGGVANE